MKKKLAKVFGGIFAFALLLTGCATVSNVKNDSREILYYGGSAVTVGDYTYFANAYTPYDSNTDFDYNGNAKISYLARINNKDLSADGKDFSPSKVEKVNDKVTGFQNQDMFVLGDYIYFTSMNTHQYGNLEHDYSLVTLFRSKLNGDNLKELFTTEYFKDGQFAPVGDVQNGYYWICYTGAYSSEEEYSGQIISIDLNGSANAEVIAKEVTSAAFANVREDGNLDKVIYTTTATTDTSSEYQIYGIDYSGENKTKYNCNNTQITLIDKIEDKVFYSLTDDYKSYYRDIASIQENETFTNSQRIFAYSTGMKNIQRIAKGDAHAEGYVYLAEGGSLMYKLEEKTAEAFNLPQPLLKSDKFSDVLFVDDERVYLSNDTSISRISVKDIGKDSGLENIVTLTSIQSGKYGYDGTYVYFFGKLEDVEVEGQSEDDENSDTNSYMYRVRKSGGEYQLIGKTVDERKPKQDS